MIRPMNDGWTDEQLDTVKRMVADGRSATEIGKAIGKSRNAVIGKILRMGGKLGRLSPKTPERSAKTREGKWVEGGRGRPPASVKPRAKAVAGNPQPAVEAEWDRAPQQSLAKASGDNGRITGGAGPAAGEASRLASGRTASATSERMDVTGAESAASNPVSRKTTFLDAITKNLCLFYCDEPMAAAGPDMKVCGAARAEEPHDTRWCAHHQGRVAPVEGKRARAA